MRPALISGITSGTFGIHAEGGGIVDRRRRRPSPRPARTSGKCRRRPRTARCRRLRRSVSVSSSITILSPRKSMVLPAERALASAFSLPTRKPRLSMVAMNSAPTAPVTPAMATTGSFFTLALHQAIKKPRTFSGGASGSDDAIVRLRAHASRGPGGLAGFRGAFGGRASWRGLMREICGWRQRLSDGKSRINEVEPDAVVTP